MVGLEQGQVPAHSAARLMAAKKQQHKVITFMYNITYYLLAKIDITHMGYNPVITPPLNFVTCGATESSKYFNL